MTAGAAGGTGFVLNDTFSGATRTLNSSYGDVTLTAQWTTNSYTVTFNANATDATGSMNPQVFTYGIAQNLTTNTFIRQNYVFAGWATSATGAKVYDDGQNVINLTAASGGTVELFAVWQRTAITVVAVTGVLEPLVGNTPDAGAACISTGVDAVSNVG